VTDFPWLVLMIAVPAVGAGVTALLPKGRDLLAKQIALGVSLVVLLLAVLAALAFDADGDRFQLTTSVAWIPDFGTRFALGVDGIALVMLLGAGAAWLFVGRREVPVTAPTRVSFVTRAARKALYADTINESLFMRPGQWLTRALVFFDNRGVDGAVNGLAATLGGSSSRLGRTQTGFVRTYALGMLGGAVLVAGALLAVTAG
jgi:NADH:ubiquinone oxidoreductase subunit 5 (subunit L)/multisubunit Na+/H+ antiporter MnhA subunit